MTLQDKACIVTGAGRGIGRSTVLRLVARGANVVAAARTAESLDETVSLTESLRGKCIAHPTDMTKSKQVDALIARCEKEFGSVDVLVNNAGAAPLSEIDGMDDETFQAMVDVNINGVFYAVRAAWGKLKASQGTVVNISSMASMDPFPGLAAYGATKAWVNLYTKALANEGKEHGITAFAVAPGAVETEMLKKAFPEFPMEQALQPDEIAAMVEWVLEDRCRYSTGQTIFVAK